MHAPIVTLTMNPALDVSTSVDRVVPERQAAVRAEPLRPGGGGVNVTRAIRNLGGSTLAVYPLGGPTGQAYRGFAEEAGVVGRVIAIAGEHARELHDRREVHREAVPVRPSWSESRGIRMARMPRCGARPSPSRRIPRREREAFHPAFRWSSTRCSHESVLPRTCASWSTQQGRHSTRRSPRGCSSSSRAETSSPHSSAPTGTLRAEEQLAAAQAIVGDGRAEIVALTLGAAGALLVSSAGALRLPTPDVQVASAVGAGDAFLGALVLRLAEGRSIESAFRAAVAAGSATAMRPATELCHADDVARLEKTLSPE